MSVGDKTHGPAATAGPERLNEALKETREANAALLLAGLRAQKAADDATEARERLEALVSGLAEGMIVLDGSATVLLLNPAAREILDLPSLQIGEKWRCPSYRQLDGSLLAEEERPVARALSGERFTDLEGLIVPERGPPRRCLLSGNSLQDEQGAVEVAIIVVRDVTDMRNLEELREDYLSLISHDLRNPLAVVTAAAERISREFPEDRDAELHEIAGLLSKSSTRMNEMIADLMRAASLESGQLTPEMEPVAVRSLAEASINRFRTTTDRHIEFVPPDCPLMPVMGDPALVERVIANLLANAVKYSPSRTPIIVQVDPAPTEVTLSVRDEGRGISKEAQALVFDRFYRVRENAEHTTGGYGLGLYICRLIIEAHRGRIWVESEPGAGSTFSFTLPAGLSDGD